MTTAREADITVADAAAAGSTSLFFAEAVAMFLEYLKSYRSCVAVSIKAYGRDIQSFEAFLTESLGQVPPPAQITRQQVMQFAVGLTPRCPNTHLASRMPVVLLSWYSLPSCIPLRGEVPGMEKAVERRPDWAGLPVIATVARLLCRELTLQNEYLRLESRLLREKVPGRLRFTDEERRSLVAAAVALGRSLMKEVVSIVQPETILAWQRRLEQQKWDYSERRSRGPGRPRTPVDVEALVCRLARENIWGYQRLRGELLKLRVILSKGCIADILRRNGRPPSPQRAGLTWQQFLSRHAEVMLCADLFTKEVWTLAGLRTAYVLFVLHLGTRRILLAEATFSPHGPWMGQMARNLLMRCEDLEIAPRYVLHDRDQLLAWDFDAVLTGAQTKVVKTPFRAPDANAHAERWVRSVTEECLDHLILVGLSSLHRALRAYVSFFNGHRPHQGIGNRIPERRATGAPDQTGGQWEGALTVECEPFLGGLLNSYYRKAA